uniref:Crp/Fnr family transcriptional regulator n=1 Tax=Castellaniella defragrans TaxID=75697 RepID=UPI00333ECB97
MDSSSGRRRGARIQDYLAQIPLFNELPPVELEPIAAGTTELHVARGDIIFRRGEPCLGLHFVIYGQVKLMFVSQAGDEKVVRLIGPNDSFGEALMFMGKDYIVTAQALTDTLLLHVGREVLFEEIERRPTMAYKLLAGLSIRLHSLMGDVEAYSLRTGAQRMIGYLLKGQVGGEGVPFRLETSKAVIASRLNLTPEHFSRILRELSEKGLIRVRGREITILDMEALAHYEG